jgi:predicted PhzF superfamily epimerase YddE/YHI9
MWLQAAFELRAIYYDERGTFIEDPVTGSLNASVGEWLFATGRASGGYVAAQGTLLKRTGRVHVSEDHTKKVWVGGRTHTLVQGEMPY